VPKRYQDHGDRRAWHHGRMGAPIRLAPGLWRVPTLGRAAINSFALEDDDGTVTLIDAGLRGATAKLTAALAEIGHRPCDVARIVLTHAHPDHAGAASELRARTSAPVQLHHHDAADLRAGRRPPPDPTSPLGRVLAFGSPHQPACAVDQALEDGQRLPVAGGVTVLHTPGHSPGHCSFLHERSGVLITGDALFNFRSRISWSVAAFCSDFAMSKETARRLGDVDYEIAAFTHGPEIRAGAREAVRRFLSTRR